jgi:hypothetical protein
MTIASRLLFRAKQNLWLDVLPAIGTTIDGHTIIARLNEPYGVYGHVTALAGISPQNDLIIMYKGTDDLSDVIADIQSSTQDPWYDIDPTGTAQFNNGMIDAFQSIVVPWLNSFISRIQRAKSLTLIGHSAGGAYSLYTAIYLKVKFNVTSVIYIYATPVFGNHAAKQLLEGLKLELYDVTADGDPIPAIDLPWTERAGNGAIPPQRNYVIMGPVAEPWLISTPTISWYVNPANASRHRLQTYISSLANIAAAENGGIKCTYNASALRNDPTRACFAPQTRCIKDGKLVPCGAEGWCGTNNYCISKHMPYNCTAATDCNVGGMCVTPGYHLPASSWDSLTETCKSGATCSRNPWDLQKYCWNK